MIWSVGASYSDSPAMTDTKCANSARYDWMNALSRAAAPRGETSIGRPCSSLTTRRGANRELPRVESVSNHQRSSSPMYDADTSKLKVMPDVHLSCTIME